MLLYGNMLNMILAFIETMEVFELEVGKTSCLLESEYMNTYEYQRSRSLFDFCQR